MPERSGRWRPFWMARCGQYFVDHTVALRHALSAPRAVLVLHAIEFVLKYPYSGVKQTDLGALHAILPAKLADHELAVGDHGHVRGSKSRCRSKPRDERLILRLVVRAHGDGLRARI